MKALIIGGGIGGLTTALSLHAAGIDCTVFEAATDVRPLGVGINLQPHAVRELTELGLGDRLAQTGIATQEFVYANRFGQVIWREPRGLAAGYRWPQYSIHRGRLQVLLWRAAEERLGPGRLQSGKRLVDFRQDGTGVTARFADGGTARGDLLVAADGIHSVVRARCFPDEGPPKWNGALLWRATSLAPPYLTGASMVQAGHRDRKFVCYPIGTAPDGRAVVNWIAEQRYPADTPWAREDWNRPGQGRHLPAAVRGLAVRLAGRSGADPLHRGRLRVPDGGPRPAALVEPGARDAARGRGASDVSDRQQRSLAGDPGCPHPGPRTCDPGM